MRDEPKLLGRHNRDHAENGKRQGTIACGFHLRPHRFMIDAFRENAPGNLLRNDGLRRGLGSFVRGERPSCLFAIQMPTAAALTGNCESNRRSRSGGNVAVSERQSAQETIQNGVIKLACYDARTRGSRRIGGQANLLLMMPTLGVLPRGVESVGGFSLASPAHTIRSHSV